MICLLTPSKWQAGSRQQVAAGGFEPDKNNWGWNWLERWMAVRPWENRFLDINVKEGVIVSDNEQDKGAKSLHKPMAKKPISTLHSNMLNHKAGPSHSEGSASSSGRSANPLASASATSKIKLKTSSKEASEEALSQPTGLGARSYSNPKERRVLIDSQAKKRLSLPNSGKFGSVICLVLLILLYFIHR